MTELPWLYHLIRLSDLRRYDTHGILDSNVRDRGVEQATNKVKGGSLLRLFLAEPSRSRNC
jgi:hypothetical protein